MGYSVTWEDRGVTVEYFGHVSPQEMHESVEKVAADERFDRIRYRINDFSRVTSFDWSEADLERTAAVSWAASLSKTTPRGSAGDLIAHVVTDPRLVEPIDAYHAQGIVPYRYRILPSIDAARAWIDDELRSQR